jgi:hypothetical protein
MKIDDAFVLSVNVPVVGSFLLEFVYALSEHTGWSRNIKDCARSLAGAFPANKVATLDLLMNLDIWMGVWGHVLLSIDEGITDKLEPDYDLDEVCAFTKSFFEMVDKSRYVIF